ncbi:MAG TPA: sodium-translocating pyrophosphatase [Candidatus Aenigmarchaeota archaeon]|nr:sodium-translocating pyrophosphatase [Candidatus Aenigmarchaeota archaeon]
MTLEFAVGSAVLALLVSLFLGWSVLKRDQGSKKMQDIAAAIREGAVAYLNRQYKTVGVFAVILAVVIYIFLGFVATISFIAGALLSALAGYIGMMISVRANVRTAKAAENGVSDALNVSFRGGAVTGFAIVGLGLLGMIVLYLMFNDPNMIIGFGFGASLISLFARVGGGIYTKAADVGADLVGKVEKGIPEDDPRNPAVIADNVGDNVGDCAGMGADLFESYVVTLLAAMILGGFVLGTNGILYSLAIGAVGIIASVIGLFVVRTNNENKVWSALSRGMYAAAILAAIGAYAVTVWMNLDIKLFYATLAGLITTIIIATITDYYTSKTKPPVKSIAHASETGAATNIIAGLAVGMKSTILPVIVICLAILVSYGVAGVFGIALAALGLLSITGMIMSIDCFGPISDNAGGIAEMSGLSPKVRRVTDALDAVGNTTKATTKGVAIASAALSALALLAAFGEATHLTGIDITKAPILVGLLIGGAIPFLFSSYLMKAVGNAAHLIVKEVRRQFKEIKGIMTYKAKPDYKKAVDISTKAALRELIIPALIAVLAPILVGLLLGPEALGAMLAGSIVSGLLLALMLANSGAAWDNAKKYIESGNLGGKGSDAHKAAVVGDTVGDPSKDTAGPAINSLIKVMNTISILLASLFVTYGLHLV